jgi:asparagine synthase (glutamine-hydrolysing)
VCGIAGIVDFNSRDSSIELDLLKKMTDVIVHRGPDSEGYWISGARMCGLAFRRLSIVDLSPAGNQPMQTLDGRHTIVFNGEIYNHLNIRRQLTELGFNYRSRSDTETIINGYSRWGEGILDKMVGMWGLAIWDDEKKELFAARDRIGIKPFYYYFKDGLFVFGSEIKSILCHPKVRAELNIDALPIYLNYGMTGNCDSLFKNIKKLPAGHFLKLDSKGNLSITRYWCPFEKAEYAELSRKEVIDELLRLLRQSVEARMMSDVPFGAFLSGGIDSSLNVALMSELMSRPVDTFTVGFKDLEQYNELNYARKTADLFKTNHHEILIDKSDAFDILENLVWHEDEPNGDPVCIPLYFLSKLTRDSGTIVIQVGEGSDEQFIGYESMLRDWNFYSDYWKKFKELPSVVKKSIYFTAKPLLRSTHKLLELDYLRRATFDKQLYWGGKSYFPPVEQELLFSDAFNHLSRKPDEYTDTLHQTALELRNDADYLQRMVYVELASRLPEMLLMRVDKIGMAHSIEARVPFLDHRIVEFVMSIKPAMRVPDKHTTKSLLKEASRGIIPDEIIDRRKQGFWAPVQEWLRADWHDFAKDKILNSSIINTGLFNKCYIEQIFRRHRSGKGKEGVKLYFLLMLAMWGERFID